MESVIDLNEDLWDKTYIEVGDFLLFMDDGLQRYIDENDSETSQISHDEPNEAYRLRSGKPVMFIKILLNEIDER